MNKITFGEKFYIHSIIITIIFFIFYLLGINNSFLYTSILDFKNIKSDSFDGTVYPIEFVPDPLKLNYNEIKKNFEEIDSSFFIKTPIYNPDIFERNLDDLVSGSKEYNDIITQRIIFPVPYMGTYNFDFKEFSGSHPGIDIIAPKGTPVKNIAAGVIVDIGYQGGGFGNYVLIKHNNVPLQNGELLDIYSLYAHLSKSVTILGNKIKKGELIGYVGDTGIATTPHLHFQIDLVKAPYSPYWPFNISDIKSAKVGFFDGINIGLGRENVIKYTINPLKFVNEYLSLSIKENIKEENIKENELLIKTDEIKDESKNEKIYQDIKLNENINIENNIQILKKEDIINNDVELLNTINTDLLLSNSLDIPLHSSNDNILLTSTTENLLDNSNKIKKIDNSNIYKQETLFSDIKNDYKYFTELKYFKDNNFISGFYDGSFKPNNNITRIESLKIILLTNKSPLIKNEASKFLDINTNSWENTYVNSALKLNLLSYKKNKFFPFRNISKVESLKLILNLAGVNFTDNENNLKILDVHNSDWYYKYVNYAIKNNLLELKNNRFYPNKPLTREELIIILYKINVKK